MLRFLTALCALLLAFPLSTDGAPPDEQPALLRMRAVLTTASPEADLTLDPGDIINASVVSGDGSVRVQAQRNHVSLQHDGRGSAEANVRLLVSGVRPDTRLRWHLTLSASNAPARLEVYNENQGGRSRLVDRFDARARESIFESRSDLLWADGPVRIEGGPRPLVLTFFYPWYQHFNWDSERLLDRPAFLYSTDLPDEVARSLSEVRKAGLDGVIVSWRGDTDWNDRRLQIVLDQAQKVGLTVSILVETLWATEGPEGTVKPFSLDKMRLWLAKAYDVYGRHPAFLRTGGRPVIFVYVADAFTTDEWRTAVQSLKRSRRSPFLMADTLDPAFLESFDGAFTYGSIPPPELKRLYSDQALVTKSYNLARGGERRVDAATVSPGYDDSLLNRETTHVVDRANGAMYEARWQMAVAAQPDWILITSWNEFWENTYIEPSERYGRQYQDRTRIWSELFRWLIRRSSALVVQLQGP